MRLQQDDLRLRLDKQDVRDAVVDEKLAALLCRRTQEINRALRDDWTPETLAASFLEHVLVDDEATHCIQ